MSFPDFVDLTSDDDDEVGEADLKCVKKEEPGLVPSSIPPKEQSKAEYIQLQRFTVNRPGQGPEENGLDTTQSSPCELDQESPTVDGSNFASSLPPAPICRQFWKAGSYHDTQVSENLHQSGHNHLRVHPKFLHSNATSHKWAFGAVAELLDNAFDEIQNGATFVMVDKTSNPRDGSQALLIQDDGGGMDPESMRHCMSFGFSEKKSKLAIGQYGNGFKTSTMRLGADVIVFSRHNNQRTLTQSVGLLSYTFLRQTGHDRIVVPMVDFQFSHSAGKFVSLVRFSEDHFSSNLSMILQWSPYRTKAELLKQFDGIGQHGTKVIVYNLWFSDDGDMELDFESDAEDILLRGAPEAIAGSSTNAKYQQHIATRLHYSLRVYLSILYLRVPKHFRIILRGRVVEHHNIADDLKHLEFIMYKPSQVDVNKEALVITTIGFLNDAPHVNIHGFSVYHKNRLIMPFWRVVNKTCSKGKGVVGVLEANFIEPIHNKQEFERTTLFQKLEARLKDMTLEYWDLHCRSIGYHQIKKFVKRNRLTNQQRLERSAIYSTIESSGVVPAGDPCRDPTAVPVPSQLSGGRQGECVANFQPNIQPGLSVKRKEHGHMVEPELVKRQAQSVPNAAVGTQDWETQPANGIKNVSLDQGTQNILQENERLRAECSMYEKREEELNLKVQQLRAEVIKASNEYRKLLAESRLLDAMKKEKM